jgi:hypothetical protein
MFGLDSSIGLPKLLRAALLGTTTLALSTLNLTVGHADGLASVPQSQSTIFRRE